MEFTEMEITPDHIKEYPYLHPVNECKTTLRTTADEWKLPASGVRIAMSKFNIEKDRPSIDELMITKHAVEVIRCMEHLLRLKTADIIELKRCINSMMIEFDKRQDSDKEEVPQSDKSKNPFGVAKFLKQKRITNSDGATAVKSSDEVEKRIKSARGGSLLEG